MTRAILALSLLLPLYGQDVNAIRQRNREANEQNDERAKQYTYVEETDSFEYDKKGQLKKTGSETHDVIFVEGETYKRLVARDGKPLPPKEEAKENMILRQGMSLALAGVVIGLGAAWGVARVMESLLFGVKPRDPVVFVAVPLVLATVALLAVWLPARRALQVDPAVALRHE